VLAAAGVLTVLERWPEHRLVEAARCLMPAPMTKVEVLGAYDAYYYKRQVQSMYGADERRLPVLRVTFGDPDATWVHLDGYTGQVGSSLDRSERAGRWLFNLLHSWDLPAMLAPDRVRQGVLLALGLGGTLLSMTATVLGLRRMGKWSGKGVRQT